MPSIQAKSKAPFLSTMRELARAYQAFANYSDRHVRELGLTPSQFDAIATLGNTDGMSMTELAAATLVTKGTLTGIVDRLEKKGLVVREVPPGNRRSFIIRLTPAGDAEFQRVFPVHITYIQERFEQMPADDLKQLTTLLTQLREQF